MNAVFRLQVIPSRDFFFKSYLNVTNTSIPPPRHRLQLKSHRYCYFEPLFYPAVMMFEEVHMPLSLWRKKRILLPHRDAWDNGLCSAGKETFFLTDSSQQNNPSLIANEWKFGGSRIWFWIIFSQQHNWTRHNNSAALRTKQHNITNGLGCQDSRGGVNSTHVQHICAVSGRCL